MVAHQDSNEQVTDGTVRHRQVLTRIRVLASAPHRLREVLADDARAIVVHDEVHDAFNAAVDAENRRMAWG